MMKPYTIQEFADLSGVSIDRLRHYEKLNLMKPRRNARNGYRYYSVDHLLDVYRICFMQSLDVPLKDIPREVEERKTEERIAQRIGEMEAEIARLRLQMDRLTSICRELEHSEEKQGCTCDTQKYYVLYYDRVEQNAKGKDVIAQWMRHMPLVYPVFEIRTDEIAEKADECLQPRMGLAIEKRYADEIGLDRSVLGIEEETGVLLPYRMHLTNPMNPTAAEFAQLLGYCRENGIECGKKLVYRVTAGECSGEGYSIRVCLPVQTA